MSPPTPTRRERILGALLGVHAGDSLGATVEFAAWEDIQSDYPEGVRDIVGGGPFNWPPGHATDDTDLTRAVLLAYRDAAQLRQSRPGQTADVVQLAAQHMADWYDGRWPGRVTGQRPRDVGDATAVGITKFMKTGNPRASGAGEGRAGNGSLMRCIPTALFQPDPDEAYADSAGISAVTHDDYHCTIACAVYNAMVRALVDGQSPDDAVLAGKAEVQRAALLAGAEPTAGANIKMARAAEKVGAVLDAGTTLLKIRELAENGPWALNAAKMLPYKASGYVLESLALAAAALMDPRPLEDVLVDVVRFGQDTDTNAAIAGGLLGARDGINAIPMRWRERLQFGTEFTELVETLITDNMR